MGDGMRKDFKRYLVAVLFLAVGPGFPVLAGTSAERDEAGAPPGSAVTVEPAPPIALNVRLVKLERNTEGGIATVSTEVNSPIHLDEVTLKMDLPVGVSFTDGTRTRAWTFDLPAGGTSSVAVDLLVSADGKYVISVEAASTSQRRAIHRGSSFRLLVGVEETPAPLKDGTIEYPGAPDGGA